MVAEICSKILLATIGVAVIAIGLKIARLKPIEKRWTTRISSAIIAGCGGVIFLVSVF